MIKEGLAIDNLDNKDLEILCFINKYKFIRSQDFIYFYDNIKYYNYKIKPLEKAGLIRKFGWYYVLGINGKREIEKLGYKYNRIQYSNKFMARQKVISHFAAMYYNRTNIKFIPSIDLKDEKILTNTSRKYIGSISIDKTKYLAYYISKNHTKIYIRNLIYDVKKEKIYNNFIIFVEDIEKIDIQSFAFGKKKLYIVPMSEKNIKIIENIDKIDYQKIFKDKYKEKVYLSGHSFCEYYINESHFVYTMPLINPEKIVNIKYFTLENKHVKVDVLYSKNISPILLKNLNGVKLIPIDYSKYIQEEFKIYE